ncbi:helicase-related protein [Streptomyces sp. H10-C2]|uniref:helicase-related protein n=1 Tax=unclassified Streptomyces TaxID=2593676 RepID=UPI0024B9EC12|nr:MULTISPECIES: helicase-related protein [unclassified Streptomyces]MDJ0342619.1 helicase-related protein [Streptomyces sp. PH10-H1]MDJ0368527.1 helicase-related protein [Streptomyces sp. H10-C2]
MSGPFQPGWRVRLPHGPSGWLTVDFARPDAAGGWIVYVAPDGQNSFTKVVLTADEAARAEVLARDGGGSSAAALAGMWTCWMTAAAADTSASLLSSSPLRPYTHQINAVYGAMLPQPWLRFLLADEPGTGKTVMAGLYMREMQRIGLIRRALVVVPAGLVTKWQADFERFFGGGLRRVTAATVREGALELGHDLWIVSLELAAVNAAVQDAIRPDLAGWDLVVFDEAHRLTATAQSFHRVGRLLTGTSPRALLMTATPHRGSEWLFRHLLHLVDPEVYPDPGDDSKQPLTPLRPGSTHFLRRMKEDLVDYDGVTRLFKRRHATNHRVPLAPAELEAYTQALQLVDQFFPATARPLARMVYGKRAASSLYALAETLKRRSASMGAKSQAQAAADADPEGDDQALLEEARVVHSDSRSPRSERSAISQLLAGITEMLRNPEYVPSKWHVLVNQCLAANGILPGGRQQAVVFTEYADSAEWIAQRLTDDGYPARTYSGRQAHVERDKVRAAFMAGDFQVIVATDAGNEGIDLQVAHVLVNFDIPWSLVRLEQRMGRIHRVGQERDVELYNLVAVDTREGDTLHTLLERFVTAANELDGQMFDSLSLVAELSAVPYEDWLRTLYGDDELKQDEVLAAVRRVSAAELKRRAEAVRGQEAELASAVDVAAGLARLRQQSLEGIHPVVVGAYIRRLAQAGVLRASHTAAGEDVMLIEAVDALPQTMGGSRQALVSIGGAAPHEILDAEGQIQGPQPVSLGHGTPALAELVAHCEQILVPDVYRGGTVEDPAATSPYELMVFASAVYSAASPVRTPWFRLIRADPTGETRGVRWEILAGLAATDHAAGRPDPLVAEVAESEARRLLAQVIAEQKRTRRDWYAAAKRDLSNLPVDVTLDIPDRGERLALRDRLTAASERRLAQLEELCQVEAEPPRLLARLQVVPGQDGASPHRRQAEAVAADHVRRLLEGRGWTVDDVRAESRGFQLCALRGQERRMALVKGVWRSIDDEDIRLHENELLMSAQHRSDYVLYVVESCHDGVGQLFASFRDPFDVLTAGLHPEPVVRLSGDILRSARKATSVVDGSFPDQETL